MRTRILVAVVAVFLMGAAALAHQIPGTAMYTLEDHEPTLCPTFVHAETNETILELRQDDGKLIIYRNFTGEVEDRRLPTTDWKPCKTGFGSYPIMTFWNGKSTIEIGLRSDGVVVWRECK